MHNGDARPSDRPGIAAFTTVGHAQRNAEQNECCDVSD
jgi:hypothetical protein